MKWNKLTDLQQLQELKTESEDVNVLIFKHSTRCSISSAALNRLERAWQEGETGKVKPYYLDLLSFREISDRIASEFSIEHESPQILLVRNGDCIYTASHMGISYKDIVTKASE